MNRSRLFLASCLALIATAMSFAIRGDIMGALGLQFSLDNQQLGLIAGTAFWGFTLAMVFGGPLCDVVGMRVLLIGAFALHAAGIATTVLAQDFWMLFTGTLFIGLANGLVEAACNPLIATLYPESKTEKLNNFHVWFPGGIVIGGLAAFALSAAGLDWRAKMLTMLLPTLIYGALFLGQKFPRTERVSSGVSTGAMFRACVSPLFLLMVGCMLLTAASELGPGQWIPNIMQNAGVAGILVLVWINGLMAVGRQFAGPIVHRLSPSGVLFCSAILTALGLIWLSFSQGAMLFAAATVFALGVCYFWPTMLGFVAERIPKSGALGLAIMGGAGMLSVSLILPVMGAIYDAHTLEALSQALPNLQISSEFLADLKAAPPGSENAETWLQAQARGGLDTLRVVAILPAVLIPIFGLLFLFDRRRQRARTAAAAVGP